MGSLFAKYDIPAPRYTSYPTVPFWRDVPTTDEWIHSLTRAFEGGPCPWSLYLHIPFCESLCCYCACNTTISRNHARYEAPYVKSILTEWETYRRAVPSLSDHPLRNLHLGGGTPTFLAPENLRRIVGGILSGVRTDEASFEGSIEVHPNHTSREHLETLRDLGFNRISLGVQDFNSKVQKLVNRIQAPEVTERTVSEARALGYRSVNFDLIYGLPGQGLAEMTHTVERTLELRPDRIALYSLAIVPWIKPAQRHFKDEDLPASDEKRALYETARSRFLEGGYVEIGMDHFALPDDDLARALEEGRLHRNFMGYTDQRTDVLLGLGVSAISETSDCFHQNEKNLPRYQERIESGQIATLTGHKLNDEDRRIRAQVLSLMTKYEVTLADAEQERAVRERLAPLAADGIVVFEGKVLRATQTGRSFLRVICMALDECLLRTKPQSTIFSSAV